MQLPTWTAEESRDNEGYYYRPKTTVKATVLKRNHVYCGTSFAMRLADWFAYETKRRAAAAKAEEPCRTKIPLPPMPPTRVQPSRSAKRKAADEAAAAAFAFAAPRKKRSRPGAGDYVLPSHIGDDDFDQLQQQVLFVLCEKVAELEAAGAGFPPAEKRCAVAEMPLGCADLAHCLHGWKPKTPRGGGKGKAPEAEMLPSPTLGNWDDVGPGEEVLEDLIEDVSGLRFAVDVCSGSVRVAML